MKVALFLDSPRPGGAERYFVALANGLVAAGVDTHAVSPVGPATDYLQERLDPGVTLHDVGVRLTFDRGFARNVLLALRPFGKLRRAFAQIAPDVLHISNGGYPGSHVCRAAALATSVPRLMTINSRAQPRAGARGVAYRVLDPLVWRALWGVVCPSDAAAESALRLRGVPPEKMHVVHYGIEPPTAEADEVARARAELSADGQLLVGMIAAPDSTADARHKGHGVLLDALVELGPDAPVAAAVIGHDPGPAFVEAAARAGIAERVTILPGFRDTRAYMHAFDVLVLPATQSEALPLVALEAMASGTPVVGSRLSGIPEAVVDGETGLLFEPGDASALAAHLRRCAEDRELLVRLADAGRRRFDDRFSARRMVEATLSLYRQALGGGS